MLKLMNENIIVMSNLLCRNFDDFGLGGSDFASQERSSDCFAAVKIAVKSAIKNPQSAIIKPLI